MLSLCAELEGSCLCAETVALFCAGRLSFCAEPQGLSSVAELGGSLFCDELVWVSFVLSPRALFCVLSLEGSICAEL